MKISIYSNHKTVKTIKPKPEHFRKIADTNWRLKRADRKLTFWPRVETLRTKVYLKLIMNDSALFDFIFRRFRFTWRRSKLTRDLCKICVSLRNTHLYSLGILSVPKYCFENIFDMWNQRFICLNVEFMKPWDPNCMASPLRIKWELKVRIFDK